MNHNIHIILMMNHNGKEINGKPLIQQYVY